MTTYADRELSVADSEPIELYAFTRDDGITAEAWRYANCETSVLFRGDVYSALPGIHRSTIQQTGEASSMTMTADVPRTAGITNELRGTIKPTPITLTVFRAQRGLSDDTAVTIFIGEVSAPVFSGSICTVTASAGEARWTDTLLRVNCARTCPLMLYEPQCGADPVAATFTVQVTDISADGHQITIEELESPVDHLGSDSAFYINGYLTLAGARIFIAGQAGAVLSLQTPLAGDGVDTIGAATAGCDRTRGAAYGCASHNNSARFLGFDLIPVVSPWAGLQV